MDTLTQRLQALSSAEDFLRFFGVAYDEQVVRVNRLHILKRFHQYLNRESMPAGDEVATFRRYRELLAKSYADFVASTPAREKVFKVFHDAEGVSAVPVNSLRQSLAERRRTPA